MKKFKSLILYIPIVLLSFTFTSCGDDDETSEEVDVFTDCCSPEPVFGANVDNLDQSVNGEISVSNIFTPNGDGVNDSFGIENIENYDNHIVTIYDIDDNIVFESNNYVGYENLFPDGELSFYGSANYPDGTYKYKIIIENEETFKESGFFCLFTNNPPIEQNFAECDPLQPGEFDQILTGL